VSLKTGKKTYEVEFELAADVHGVESDPGTRHHGEGDIELNHMFYRTLFFHLGINVDVQFLVSCCVHQEFVFRRR